MGTGSAPVGQSLPKVTVTVVLAVGETTHVGAVPEQPPPDQPEKLLAGLGDTVSVTVVPAVKTSLQSVQHLMPAGAEDTLPFPRPAFTTLRVKLDTSKTAVTTVGTVIDTVHVGVLPEQPPPDHPENAIPASGVAVRVTLVP
jgi:hypothetical protein